MKLVVSLFVASLFLSACGPVPTGKVVSRYGHDSYTSFEITQDTDTGEVKLKNVFHPAEWKLILHTEDGNVTISVPVTVWQDCHEDDYYNGEECQHFTELP